jgi:type II secretory pathway component PulK
MPGFTVSAIVGDESGRLNVNTATREMLLRLPGMTEQGADSILDWRDADDDPRPQGAESDYYLSLPSPYEAANGPFETIDELRLVRGIDKNMFEGDGTQEFPSLRNLVTVRSGEQNVDGQGRPRLNINTASREQLSERLGDILSGEEVAAIVRRTQQGRLPSLASTLAIEGVSWRKMARALDRICVDGGRFVEGTVNLNTASETVLEAIGLTPEIAQAITEKRAAEPLETKGALADIQGVNQEIMRAVADHIATKSSIFRVAAWAQAEDRPVVSSVLALLDRGSKPANIILWREEFVRQAQPASYQRQERQGSGS